MTCNDYREKWQEHLAQRRQMFDLVKYALKKTGYACKWSYERDRGERWFASPLTTKQLTTVLDNHSAFSKIDYSDGTIWTQNHFYYYCKPYNVYLIFFEECDTTLHIHVCDEDVWSRINSAKFKKWRQEKARQLGSLSIA